MTSNQGIFAMVAVLVVLLFVFRDQIGLLGDDITSDTRVTWSSCVVTDDAKGAPYKFLRCTEPTMVWMVYSETGAGNVAGTREFRLRSNAQQLSTEMFNSFRKAHQLSADMTNTSEQVSLGEEYMLWQHVYAQQIWKRSKLTSEEKILGHGVLASRYAPEGLRMIGCVSHTDSDALCENASADMLYDGFDATLKR